MVYQVGEEYIFRIPSRKVALPLLRSEGELLPKVGDFITIPYLKPIFCGKWEDERPFLGYTYVPGQLPLGLSDEERGFSTKSLARFLKHLHATPLKTAREYGVPQDSRGLLNRKTRREKMFRYLSVLKPHLKAMDLERLSSFIYQIEESPANRKKCCFMAISI